MRVAIDEGCDIVIPSRVAITCDTIQYYILLSVLR